MPPNLRPNLRPLPKPLVDKIRTGVTLNTVPQAVVELLCNSLDAEARTVLIKLNAATLSFTVEDDGCGIYSEDLELVGTRYHTSKLRSLTDYAAGILTLGFRGEATSGLASIAAELAVTTRARGRFETLSKVLRNGGAETRSGPSAVALTHCGTVVVVKRLLYNQPVRQRQLAAQPRETEAETIQAVLRTALPFAATAVTLVREPAGQVLLHLPKGRDMRALFMQLCPEQPAAALPWMSASAPVPSSGSSSAAPAAVVNGAVLTPAATASVGGGGGSTGSTSSGSSYTVRALLGSPAAAYPHPQHQYVYVNRRHVRHPQLAALLNAHFLRAHLKAGHHLLGAGSAAGGSSAGGAGAGGPIRTSSVRAFPAFLVCIECPAAHYDVTSEPDKSDLVFRHLHLVSGLLRQLANQAWGGSDGGGSGSAAGCGSGEGEVGQAAPGREAERGGGGEAAAAASAIAAGGGSAVPAETARDGKLQRSGCDKQHAAPGGEALGASAGNAAGELLEEETSPTLSGALASLRASEGATRGDAATGAANGGLKQLGAAAAAAAAAAADGPLRGLLCLQSAGRAAAVGMQSKSLSVAAVGALAAETRGPRPVDDPPTAQPPHCLSEPTGTRIFGGEEDVRGPAAAAAAAGDALDRTPPPAGLLATAGVRGGVHYNLGDTSGGSPAVGVSPGDASTEMRVEHQQQVNPPDSSPLPDFSPGMPWELSGARCDDGMAAMRERQRTDAAFPNCGSGGSLPADFVGGMSPIDYRDGAVHVDSAARPRSLCTPGSDYDAFGVPTADDCGTGSTGSDGDCPWLAEDGTAHAAGRWAAGASGGSSPSCRAYVSPLAWSYDALEGSDDGEPPARSWVAEARHAPRQAAAARFTCGYGAASRWEDGPAQHDPDWEEGLASRPEMDLVEEESFDGCAAGNAATRIHSTAAVGRPIGEDLEEAPGWPRRGADGRSTVGLARGGSIHMGSNAAGPSRSTPSGMQQTLDAAFPVDEDDLGGGGSWEGHVTSAVVAVADAAAAADARVMRANVRPNLTAAGDMGGFLRSLCDQPELASTAASSKGRAAADLRRAGTCSRGVPAKGADVTADTAKPPAETDVRQQWQMPILVGVPIAPSPLQDTPAGPIDATAAAAAGAQMGTQLQSQHTRGGSPQDAGTGIPPLSNVHDEQHAEPDSLSPLARFLSFGNIAGCATTPQPSPPPEQPPVPPAPEALPAETTDAPAALPSPAITATAKGSAPAAAPGPVAAAGSSDTAPASPKLLAGLLAPSGCTTPSTRPARSPFRRLVSSAPPHAKKRTRWVHGKPADRLAAARSSITGTQWGLAAADHGRSAGDAAAAQSKAASAGPMQLVGAPASATRASASSSTVPLVSGGATAAAVPAAVGQAGAVVATTAGQAAAAPHTAAEWKPGAPRPLCAFFRGSASSGRRQAAHGPPVVHHQKADEVAVQTQAARQRLAAQEQPEQQEQHSCDVGGPVLPLADLSNAESAPPATGMKPAGCSGNTNLLATALPAAPPPPPMLKRVGAQQEEGDGGDIMDAIARAVVANGAGIARCRHVSLGSRPNGSSAADVGRVSTDSVPTQQESLPPPPPPPPATNQRAVRLPPVHAPRGILKKPRPAPTSATPTLVLGGTGANGAQVQEAERPAKRVRWSLPPPSPAHDAAADADDGGDDDSGGAPPVVLRMKRRAPAVTADGNVKRTRGGGPLASAASLHHGRRPAGRRLSGDAGAGYALLPEHDAAVAASAAAASSVAFDVDPDAPAPSASSAAALLPSALAPRGIVGTPSTPTNAQPASSAPHGHLQQAFSSSSPFARAAAAAAAMLPPQTATPLPSLTAARVSSPFAAAATIAAAAMSTGSARQPSDVAAGAANAVADRASHGPAGVAPPDSLTPPTAVTPLWPPAPTMGARLEAPILDLERDLLRLQAPHERLVPAEVARSGLATGATGGALRQVEGKFIPTVGADGSLLVVDQHAAHERVRLEQLTQALTLGRESGAGSTGRPRLGSSGAAQQGPAASAAERIARVDALWPGSAPAGLHAGRYAAAGLSRAALPPAEDAALLYSQQLSPAVPVRLSVQEAATAEKHLQVLAEWGWQLAPAPAVAPAGPAAGGGSTGSVGVGGSFVPPPAAVLAPQEETHQLLLAVPVVCGMALTPADLRVYLGQLHETGGSRLAPPAVLRLLRSRSCRTAVMFGDPLSNPQCGRLLAALRATALWTQCAHGRPTVAPLVHLPTLRAVLGRRRAAREAMVAAAAGDAGGVGTGSSNGGAGAGAGGSGFAGEGDGGYAKRRRLSVGGLRAAVAAGRKDNK